VARPDFIDPLHEELRVKLENGQDFPTVEAPAVDGEPMTLPDDLHGLWAVIVVYRGHW
jgi:peroxiredoxin